MVVVMHTARTAFFFSLLAAVAACSSTTPIDSLWADLETDARVHERLSEPDPARAGRAAERAAKARELADEGRLQSGRDHMRAAVLLVESASPADWELAAQLGRKAAELGEPLGLRVVAEAIDKDLMRQGKPQRYGTQWVWDAAKKGWRLYPIDAATTDEERARLGVPTYGELIRDEINLGATTPR
jgi:hypothetical protein